MPKACFQHDERAMPEACLRHDVRGGNASERQPIHPTLSNLAWQLAAGNLPESEVA